MLLDFISISYIFSLMFREEQKIVSDMPPSESSYYKQNVMLI